MKLLRRCSAPGVAVCLICRKPALLLGRLLVALLGAGFIAEAIVVCWGCPRRAMRDSSSVVERLRIPRGQKSESAVVLAFVVPVILISLRPRCEASEAPVGLAGHIETFSKVPKRLYRLFDAPVSLGPFSSGCRRAAAFVTRRTLTRDAPVYVACRGRIVASFNQGCPSVGALYNHRPRSCLWLQHQLYAERCALEADRHVCLSIETVALKDAARSDASVVSFIGGTSLSSPSLLKYRKKDPIGVLEEV
ncbi:hypothetical protein CDL15_Pgr017481 [Punica granatum]|uniref:Uncharacterized protein n=1 Tax=Punica granatum TaxID=22663 RepID=A0A218XQI3_PUNGR|nr:hypothetical protein CDL15_Pgr017481 [Punica granatum]